MTALAILFLVAAVLTLVVARERRLRKRRLADVRRMNDRAWALVADQCAAEAQVWLEQRAAGER